MQNDQLSYFDTMAIIEEKRAILNAWTFESSSTCGPSLHNYLDTTQSGSFGAFEIKTGDRASLLKQAREHINRLNKELDKRFARSPVQEQLGTLFDPRYLIEHKKDLRSADYGRSAVLFLKKKYQTLPNFDSNDVMHEWSSLKTSLSEFISHLSSSYPIKEFWKNFLTLKEIKDNSFRHNHKNILILMFTYLISPTNSAECERGVTRLPFVLKNIIST